MTILSTPSRIEYIVLSHLPQAQKLIEEFGYEAPNQAQEVVQGIKFLIREYKREAITALLKIHPDRKALIKLEKEAEDHFCSACSEYTYDPVHDHCGSCGHSNYDGTPLESLSELKEMSFDDLEKRYQELLEKSKDQAEDPSIQKQVQKVWNEIRQRKSESQPVYETEEQPSIDRVIMDKQDFFTILALTLAVGGVIGYGLKKGIT